MNWDDYGLYGWQIDHIKPLALFNLVNKYQFLEACHYTNLQPLWIDDHNIKTLKDAKTIKNKTKEKENE